MTNNIKTSKGPVQLPAFFPTIGWPGGRGEYDFLFKELKNFCNKIKHYHFLFNFSSFAFGFSIPKRDFNSHFKNFQNKELKQILKENAGVIPEIANRLIFLLDIGGNRIFNKIIFDKKQPTEIASYSEYLEAYKKFIREAKPDIFVSFDIAPSYTTKDKISKMGLKAWSKLSTTDKLRINHELLKISIGFKNKRDLIMVPINGNNSDYLKSNLHYLYDNYSKEINIIGIGGIAQTSTAVKQALETFFSFKKHTNWQVLSHGLGLGGWKNIPHIVKYGIDSCDVATPWRRACTDKVSEPYLPLFDDELNFTGLANSFEHYSLYDKMYSYLVCKCPFCKDIPLKDVQELCKKDDKIFTGKKLHGELFRKMRIRVYFHNVFQHIALLKKLSIYKKTFGEDFMLKFVEDMPDGKTKEKLARLHL